MNPEYDRLWQQFDSSLDSGERARYTVQMERLLYDTVGTIPNMFTVVVTARSSALRGPVMRTTPDAGGGLHRAHTWEWVR
jgi:ABC-type transport system substrate-binding protein